MAPAGDKPAERQPAPAPKLVEAWWLKPVAEFRAGDSITLNDVDLLLHLPDRELKLHAPILSMERKKGILSKVSLHVRENMVSFSDAVQATTEFMRQLSLDTHPDVKPTLELWRKGRPDSTLPMTIKTRAIKDIDLYIIVRDLPDSSRQSRFSITATFSSALAEYQ
jgi:hypothetical protein